MVRELFPVLTTPDLDRTLAFYRDRLGGVVTYTFPGADGPAYVALNIGSDHLGIGVGDAVPGPQRVALWVNVDSCTQTVEELRTAGVQILEEPVSQPWGEQVARVSDPDGTTVYISSPS